MRAAAGPKRRCQRQEHGKLVRNRERGRDHGGGLKEGRQRGKGLSESVALFFVTFWGYFSVPLLRTKCLPLDSREELISFFVLLSPKDDA